MEERIEVNGWKGKDEISIEEEQDNYKIIEHRKHKETKENYVNEHLIPKENVLTLWNLLIKHCEVGQEYKYKFLVRMILNHYKFHEIESAPLEMFMEAFNGGTNRAKYYFDFLYYPLKVLENKGKITYFGRGGIICHDKEELE